MKKWTSILVVLGLSAGLFTGCGDPGRRAFEKGVRAYEKGQWVRAKTEFEKSLTQQPGKHEANADALNYLGLTSLQLGELERAINYFEESRRHNPDLMEPLYNLGVVMLESGEPFQAVNHLEEAGLINLDDARPLEYLAFIYTQEERWPEARRALYEALARSPQSPRVLTALAISELYTEGPDSAKSYLMQALEANPDYPPALFNLAVIHDRWLEEPDQAKAYYEQFFAVAPGDPHAQVARRALGLPLEEDPGLQDAISDSAAGALRRATPGRTIDDLLEQAKRSADNGDVKTALNLCLLAARQAIAAHDEKEEERALQTAVALCVDQAKAHFAMGRFHMKKGKLAAALTSFKQAVALAPDNKAVHLAVAEAATEMGELDAALFSLKQAVRVDPKDPDALWALALMYDYRLEMKDASVKVYHDFERLFPGDPRVLKIRKRLDVLVPPPAEPAPEPGVTPPASSPRIALKPGTPTGRRAPPGGPQAESRKSAVQAYNRGTIYQQREDWDRAIYYYSLATEYDPTFANAWYNLGLAHARKGEKEAAKNAYLNVIERNADMLSARYNLALLHYELRQDAAAIEQLKQILERDERYAQAHYLLGLVYTENPWTHTLAKQHYHQFLSLAPNAPAAASARAWLQAH